MALRYPTVAVLAFAAVTALTALPACAGSSADVEASTADLRASDTRAETAEARSASLSPAYFDLDVEDDAAFPRANPDPAKLDVATLDRIVAEAAAQESDALVVAQDGVIITEKYFGKGPQLGSVQSVTKSVVSLAVGALIDDGRIASVDVPVATFFPEWSAGPKGQVTLRQLLTMTGGVEDTDDFWNQDDLLAYAQSQPLVYAPGTVYSYSNESAMLFAGIVAKAAGTPIDQLVRERYFAPLGITDAVWVGDAAATPQTPGGLYLTPRDLLRIGSLAKGRGNWNGHRLVSDAWIVASTANQTPLEECYGFLWWVVRPGCDGYHFGTATPGGRVQGFFADGWGGNYVAVIPSSGIVAVRTKMPASPDDELRTRYLGFTQDVATLGRLARLGRLGR